MSLDELCANPHVTPKYDLYAVINRIKHKDTVYCKFKFWSVYIFYHTNPHISFFVIFYVIVDTAYIKNNDKWYSCDDSVCSELSALNVVVSLNFL